MIGPVTPGTREAVTPETCGWIVAPETGDVGRIVCPEIELPGETLGVAPDTSCVTGAVCPEVELPGVHGVPVVPGVPDVPGVLGVPEIPGVPGIPETVEPLATDAIEVCLKLNCS